VKGKILPAPAILLTCALIVLAAPALAGGPDRDDTNGVIVIDDGGESLILHLDEGRWLRIVEEGDDGRQQTVEIDLSHLGDLVQDAIGEVREALRGLDELQIDLRLDADKNRIRIFDDEDEVFVDLGDLISDLSGSIAESLEGVDWDKALDLDDLHDLGKLRELRHERRAHGLRSQDRRELEENIEEMKAEIARLQRELRRLRQRDRH
jgi:hypothetical protein